MLSLFPSLLDYGVFAPFIVRVALGALIIVPALRGISGATLNHKIYRAVRVLLGTLLILGLWMQGAALILLIERVVTVVRAPRGSSDLSFHLLALAALLSLLLTGAGIPAFDLPL